jgi:hypothetical protein
MGDVGDVLDQVDARLELAHRALDLGVALVADHDELVAFLGQLGDLDVHLGHQRAGGVEHVEAAPPRLVLHRLAHAVGREHQRGARRHVGQVLDEDRALGLEVVDDVGVVHDLVAHVDGRAELLQRALDDLDGAVDAGAEAARLREQDFLGCRPRHRTPIRWTSKVTGCPASGWLKSNSTASGWPSWPDLLHRAGIAAQAVGRGELHHVADVVLLVRVAQLTSSLRATHWTMSGLRSPKASPAGWRSWRARPPPSRGGVAPPRATVRPSPASKWQACRGTC